MNTRPNLPAGFTDSSATEEALSLDVVAEFAGQLGIVDDPERLEVFTQTLLSLGSSVEALAYAKVGAKLAEYPGSMTTGLLPAREFGTWVGARATAAVVRAKDLNNGARGARMILAMKLMAGLRGIQR